MILEKKADDDTYADIRLLHNHLGVTGEYERLKAGEDFTAIAISSVPDIASLEFLIKKFTRIYFHKQVLHSRKAHQLMFEFSIHEINRELGDIIKIREIIHQIELCTGGSSIRNVEFNIESILYPKGFEYVGKGFNVFPAKEQKEKVIEIQLGLGLRTEGVAALLIVVWCMNGTFKNMNPAYESENDLDKLNMSKEWWDEHYLKGQIMTYAEKYKKDNLVRLKDGYDYLKVELKRNEKGMKTTVDKKRFDCMKTIVRKIKDSGLIRKKKEKMKEKGSD